MAALNKNNSAVKRIMQEARELANDPCTDYSASPLEDDIFEWHCTLRGPAGTEFEGGLYHFRILLPAEYPFRPPSIMILTPNGRFELNTKICISFTNYHEELWQPAWGVRTAIIGLQGFFPLKGQAAVGVGSIEYPAAERKRLATLSREWTCPRCEQTNLEQLADPPSAPTMTENQVDPAASVAVHSGPEDTAVTQSTLTAAQQNEMQAMAHALHHRLDTLQSAGQQAIEPKVSPNAVGLIGMDGHSSGLPVTEGVRTPLPASVPNARSQKPPMLLDTAICILLVLLFAIICRRMV